MKTLILACALTLLAAQTTTTTALPKEPRPVSYVDLIRFMGDWYEIAHVPQFFESYDCACARQRLSSRADGQIDVYISCNKDNPRGQLKELRGIAHNDNKSSNAEFTVDFNLMIDPSFWVVGLDPQYRYAVASDENGSSLYILSRTPTMDANLYYEAIEIADDQNLSTGSLEITDHRGCTYP